MTLFIKLAASAVISALLVLGGIWTGENLNTVTVTSSPTFGSTFSPVGAQQTTLSGSGVVANATSIPLTSFKTPDGRALVMSMFGTIGYAVIDPNSPNQIEDITFGGITQNANGTAVLTGVSRGMDFVTPYLASSTLARAHAGGSFLILSNTAGFYGQQFLFANGAGTSTVGIVMSSTSPPRYDAEPIWANFTTEALASVAYVNSVVAAGAANASETVKGIVQLATAAQAALGTSLGSTGARLDLPASLATSTPGVQVTNVIPVTGTNEKLSQAFLDLTQNFNVTGMWTFMTGGFQIPAGASSTSASSSITVANIATANIQTLNTKLNIPRYSLTSNSALTASGGTITYATSSPLTIPAGVMTASSTWSVTANITTCTTSSSNCFVYLRDSGGTNLATCDFGSNTVTNDIGFVTFTGANQSSLSSQNTVVSGWVNSTGATYALHQCQTMGTSAFNTANALNLVLVVGTNNGQNTTVTQYSMVVNP